MPTAHLAIDLGASSGRAVIGLLDGTPLQLSLQELHRFEHLPCLTPTGPVWDLTGIWQNVISGLRLAGQWCRENRLSLTSIGVDAWGVDWCLLGKSGELLMLPHCYRDPQNEAAYERVLGHVGGREALYERNGIQLMPINTLFQVAARFEREPEVFSAADRLLFLPDLFHFWLTGTIAVERTVASTSAMLELNSGEWDFDLLEMLNIPKHLFRELIEPGHLIGALRPQLATETGLAESVRVISPASHDTAAAVAAIPAINPNRSWAFLSSGTWSLLGVELKKPFINSAACAAPFTNERGIDQSVRFLKNIAGLWLVQELQRDFEKAGNHWSFQEMANLARASEPWRTLVNPNDSRFAVPGGIIRKLQEYAVQSRQPSPESVGQLVRCCLESLAFSYRDTLDRLESILNIQIDQLHVVGGGVQNDLLNELTCSMVNRPVICGPIEATAIGNLLVQAIGCGRIKNRDSLREIVASSFPLQHYQPQESLPLSEKQFDYFRGLLA